MLSDMHGDETLNQKAGPLILLLLLIFPGEALSADLFYCAETKVSGFKITKEGKYSFARFLGRKFNILLNKKNRTVLLTWPYSAHDPAPIKSGEGGFTELYACKTPMAYKTIMFDCSGTATTNFASFAFNPQNRRFTRGWIFGNLMTAISKNKRTEKAEDAYVSHGKCEKNWDKQN